MVIEMWLLDDLTNSRIIYINYIIQKYVQFNEQKVVDELRINF